MQPRYIIELLTPKQSDEDFESRLQVFKQRYMWILERGAMASIPDNPMGNIHFTAMEVLDFLNLPLDPDRTLLHLNTFHRREDVDTFLKEARARGLKRLLVISGDGGPALPKLEPEDIGSSGKSVTSVELLRFIKSEYPGAFTCGVAFNQYEPPEDEAHKLGRKLAAGAEFVITQPQVGHDDSLDGVCRGGLPLWIGAWMSRRIDLLYQCVGREADPSMCWKAEENLDLLCSRYPGNGLYLTQLSFKKDWSRLFPIDSSSEPKAC